MQKRAGLLAVFIVFLLLSLFSFFFFRHPLSSLPRSLTEVVLSPIQQTFFSAFGGLYQRFIISEQSHHSDQLLAKRIVDQYELQKEAKALRDQYDLQVVPPKTLLPARVIGMKSFIPGVSLPEEIIVDKGAKQGVRKGQAVIVTNNVVGNVAEIADNRSLIRLLTNASQSLTGSTVQTEAIGVVRGKGSGIMTLENVILSDTLTEGDIVVTRGDESLEGVGYPTDLVVGKITSVDKKASDLFQTADVKSLIDFSALHTVFILTSYK